MKLSVYVLGREVAVLVDLSEGLGKNSHLYSIRLYFVSAIKVSTLRAISANAS
jgi:hypothetical protein